MADFEDRIRKLEGTVEEKCNTQEIREIVREEIHISSQTRGNMEEREERKISGKNELGITTVMSEISERKQR